MHGLAAQFGHTDAGVVAFHAVHEDALVGLARHDAVAAVAAAAPGYKTKLSTLLTKPLGHEAEVKLDFQLQPTNRSAALTFGPVIEQSLLLSDLG